MPSITQYIITLNQRVYDYIENPAAAATLKNTRDIADLQRIKKQLRGMPRPHLVLVCRESHVTDLFGAMTMMPSQMKGFYQVWEAVYNNKHLVPTLIAKRMAEMPPGTYFVFPEPVARTLGFSEELLGPGIHAKAFNAPDLEDEIPTLKYDDPSSLSRADKVGSSEEVNGFDQPTQKIKTVPMAQPKMVDLPREPKQRSSKTWLWVTLAYLAGAATSAIVLKVFF